MPMRAQELVPSTGRVIVVVVGNSGEKGQISVDISQSVIDEALRSVERHGKPSSEEKGEGMGLLAQEKAWQIQEKLDAALRVVADFENFKKRIAKEREEHKKFGCEALVKDLLPVLDNLQRAVSRLEPTRLDDSLKTGISMTLKIFQEVLGRYGVSKMESVGQRFDPHQHEAMMQRETREAEANTVVEEFQAGFRMYDRLVRPAMVVVAKEPVQAEKHSEANHHE